MSAQRQENPKSLLERHLSTSTRELHGSKNCPECSMIIPQVYNHMYGGDSLPSPAKPKKDPFKRAMSEPVLDMIYQKVVPGVTRNAAALLIDAEHVSQRFLTMAGSGDIFFPRGRRDLELLQSYASHKATLTTNPELSSRWFSVSMVCEDFGHRIN